MIPIQENRTPQPFSLFNLGFRPFFLGGALSAAVLLIVWLYLLSSGKAVHYYQTSALWHSHEMLFGYTAAVIAGFLLTAVRNWTNIQTLYGWKLALLFILWFSARVSAFLPESLGWLIAIIDLSFFPVLALSLALPIIRSGNFRNLVFIPILVILFIANLLIHGELHQFTEGTLETGIELALFMVILLITIIGGRVIPFFTQRGVPGVECSKFVLIEKTIIPLTGGWVLMNFTDQASFIAGLSFILAASQIMRVYGWFTPAVLSVPLLWVLHFSYLFIPIGLALYGLSMFDIVSRSSAFHALTVGAIGGMTLGMMARVSLGHTGRTLTANKSMVLAFGIMLLAAFIRCSVGILPLDYMTAIYLSGGLWIFSWLLFLATYAAILIQPRADGLYG